MNKMSRRDARIKAFELIFMFNTCDDISSELHSLELELKEHKKHMQYISNCVLNVYNNHEKIDELIKTNLDEKWSITRLSKMCLAILRLAICEIMFIDEIPANVSINEAVELAKIFGDDNDAPFINGILGKISK